MSGNYAGASLWGDNDDVPTVVVLSAVNPAVIFNYTTPGSMFGIDILHDTSASTPASDVLYVTVAGKHVPANEMGACGLQTRCATSTPPSLFAPTPTNQATAATRTRGASRCRCKRGAMRAAVSGRGARGLSVRTRALDNRQ